MPDNMDYQLDSELLALEAQLTELVPCVVPAELAAAVSSGVNHALIDTSQDLHKEELNELENHLELLSPAGLSQDVLSRMTEAMDRWHEHVPVDDKVLLFEQPASVPAPVQKPKEVAKSGSNMYAAVAAVALLGAAAALMVPKLDQTSTSAVASGNTTIQPLLGLSSDAVTNMDIVEDTLSNTSDVWLVPDSLSHNVTNTSDAGVLMSRDNVPHRRIRIDYVDRVTVLNKEGREIEINRPGIQYMLIPVPTN